MRRAFARLAWGLPVWWDASDELPAMLTVTAETITPAPVVNHYHLHLAPGTELSGLGLALPPGSVFTTEEER